MNDKKHKKQHHGLLNTLYDYLIIDLEVCTEL